MVGGQAQVFGLSPVLTQLGPVERGAQSSLETRLKCSRLDKIGTPTVRNVATEVRVVMKEGGAAKERPTHTNATQTVIAVESHLLPTVGMTRSPPPRNLTHASTGSCGLPPFGHSNSPERIHPHR